MAGRTAAARLIAGPVAPAGRAQLYHAGRERQGWGKGGDDGGGRYLHSRKWRRGPCLPLAAIGAYNQLQMMRQSYIYRQRDWPALRWQEAALIDRLAEVRYQQGRLPGRMENLGFARRQSVALETLTAEAVKSSEIEGVLLDAEQVRSSIARRLGIPAGGMKPPDRSVEGIVEVMLDATQNYANGLTEERLFAWHRLLFSDGRNDSDEPITTGAWRDDAKGPMAVVGNGRFGREIVHFEAPPASVLDAEMATFLEWCNAPSETDPVLKAGLAQLWFVTIHPFDDGNGRIGRAITDLLLARADGSPQRFYNMSSQIMRERKDYYLALETAQKGTGDVTTGCSGSWNAWGGPWPMPGRWSRRRWPGRSSGSRCPAIISTTVRTASSIVCWTALRAN